MADDSGQRLLDVIDDPSALDEFLGTLTAEDAVNDNVVASLARSLAAEFDVDSPNETLFDSSSANLTDISQSAVPFDFGSSSQHFQNHDLNSTEYDLGISISQSEFASSYSDNLSTTSASISTYKEFSSSSSLSVSESSSSTNQNSQISHPAPTPPPPPTHIPTHVPVSSTTSTNAQIETQQGQIISNVTQSIQSENRITQTQVAQTPQHQYASIGQLAIQQPQVLPGTSFIIDSSGQPMMVTSGNTFGNVLMAGVQPTYTVLPTQASIFSNTVTVQPQIQGIKTTHGTTASFLQPTTGASLVSSQAQNSSFTMANGKGKNPPHLLPKPSGNSSPASSTSSESNSSEPSSSIFVSNGPSTCSTGSVVVTSSAGSISMSSESFSHMIQQQAQANATNALTQPSFAIGAGGQVVQVSGMQTINQLQGAQTIYMNQFGQQVIVPTATVSQGGVQYILRQQPQQMLIQTPTQNNNTKVVRLVSSQQVPQQNSIQLQQIQTAQGPQWVAVRSSPVVSIQSQSPAPVVMAATPTKTPTPPPPPPPPPPPVTTDTISATIQSVIERLRSPSPTTFTSQQYSSPILSVDENSSIEQPPPKKKPKYSKKKKVTLDLEQLLKQSGIMDEDLQECNDGGMDFASFFGPSDPVAEVVAETQEIIPQFDPTPSPVQNGIHNNNNNNIVTPNNNFYKPNGSSSIPHTHVLKPLPKSKQRKNGPEAKKKVTDSPVINNSDSNISSSPTNTPKSKKKGGAGKQAGQDQDDYVISNSNIITPPKKSPSKSKAKKKPPETPKVNSVTADNVKAELMSPSGSSVVKVDSNMSPLATTQQQPRRYVQTIQLTPQNQTLLRNIQNQIQKLLALTTRNDLEENALQKLISLQTEVIKTGKPVPNPPHLQTLNSSSPLPALDVKLSNLSSTPLLKASLCQGQIQQGEGEEQQLDNNKSSGVNVNGIGTNCNTITTAIPPPPMLIKKSKIIVTSTKTTTNDEDSHGTTSEMQQKVFLVSSLSQGAVVQSGQVSSSSSSQLKEYDSTDDGSVNSVIKEEDQMTSSYGTIIPTTTISTSMCNTHNGRNGGLYYNSFEPALTMIDEKKLEEQLINRLKEEEETRIQWRKEEFEKRLEDDHDNFVNPDYDNPFTSKTDMAERLMHFHVGRDTADFTFEEFDEDFAETSCHLLHKFNGMVAKYRGLLLKESMKEISCSERVMLERMFVMEEKLKLEHDQQLVQQGEILELPPPPPNWIPRIREMVDLEIKEIERDSLANQQVQSAIDSIMSFHNENETTVIDEREKIEYDAFGVPISSSNYNGMNSSSADLDEAVRSILL